MSSRPRILVTLGPSSMSDAVIRQCAREDVHLFRINLSHTNPGLLEAQIRNIRSSTDVPICLDTEGAQIRNQRMRDGEVDLHEGDSVKIYFDEIEGDAANMSFTPEYVGREFVVGDRIRIDFHAACIRVIERHPTYCLATVEVGGRVGSNKAADLSRDIELRPLSAKDTRCIKIGRELGVRNYALSFAQSREDVLFMRDLVGPSASVISKIESRRGLKNLIPILDATDEILIDRGDLSRQIALEKTPFLQRRIVAIARSKSKPVYVATNLLESMVMTASANRAEVNDVISTLIMGASGLVLAAETAIGKFPVQAVAMIRRLITQFEKWTPYTSIEEILDSDRGSTEGTTTRSASTPREAAESVGKAQ